MAFPHNTNNQFPPWDFAASAQAPGAGVDHTGPQFPPGFPFGFPFAPGADGTWGQRGGRGGWPFGGGGWGGRHGRHGRHGRDEEQEPYTDRDDSAEEGLAAGEDTPMMNEKGEKGEKDGSPDTLRAEGDDHPDPPESVPLPHRPAGGPHGHGHGHGHGRGRGFHHGRRGGPCGRGGARSHHRGPFFTHFGAHGPHGHHGGPGGPPWWRAFAGHPLAQGLREYFGNNAGDNANANAGDDVESFTPPVDTFHTARGWVVHVAVPGAKKEDIGVHWDAEKSTLAVGGVVYRPGDEAFLAGLVGGGERKVGVFRREIRLPPPGAEVAANPKDEVDGDGITARMEDGVLVVEVPVLEREWTEIRQVDIQ